MPIRLETKPATSACNPFFNPTHEARSLRSVCSCRGLAMQAHKSRVYRVVITTKRWLRVFARGSIDNTTHTAFLHCKNVLGETL